MLISIALKLISLMKELKSIPIQPQQRPLIGKFKRIFNRKNAFMRLTGLHFARDTIFLMNVVRFVSTEPKYE